MRSLGFVDRLVSPWIETAQRSTTLRAFSAFSSGGGMVERAAGDVSWVFPRPWYQDELDWMAAARNVSRQAQMAPVSSRAEAAPTMLTTRGTYVAPKLAVAAQLPSSLYEYVAPSLSIAAASSGSVASARVQEAQLAARADAYSPLVSLAAVQAADVMSRAVGQMFGAPATQGTPYVGPKMAPALRAVLAGMLERAAQPASAQQPASRIAELAPALETPPAPREPRAPAAMQQEPARISAAESLAAEQIAQQYAAQRERVVELQVATQRVAAQEAVTRARAEAVRAQTTADAARAQATAQAHAPVPTPEQLRAVERDLAARVQATQAAAPSTSAAQVAAQQAATQQQAAAQQAAAQQAAQAQTATQQAARDVAVRESTDQLVRAQQAQRTTTRLHEQARIDAAAHARAAHQVPTTPSIATPAPMAAPVQMAAAPVVPPEIIAAIGALPPELAAVIGARPDRAMQSIGELNDALRAVELLARSAATGAQFQPTRGPRLVMPAGIGGLVSAVDRAQSLGDLRAPQQAFAPALAQIASGAAAPTVIDASSDEAFAATSAPRMATGTYPYAAPRASRDVRVPALSWLAPSASRMNAPVSRSAAPTSAIAATAAQAPAALAHVAWADRWLARFAGANATSLDAFSSAAGAPGGATFARSLASLGATPGARLQALADAAPGAVFVAPALAAAYSTSASDASSSPAFAPSSGAPAPTFSTPAQTQTSPIVQRIADDAETPDDVFAQIAAQATRSRPRPRALSPIAQASIEQARAAAAQAAAQGTSIAATAPTAADRAQLVDYVAHAAPSAPGAGLSASLAASPFAPALRHVIAMPTAATFDVRALFGGSLGTTYLAGLLAPASHEIEIASASPAWTSFAPGFAQQLAAPAAGAPAERAAFEWDAAYVAPAEQATDSASGTTTFAAPAGASVAAGSEPSLASPAAQQVQQLTTLRSALLSWDLPAVAAAAAASGDPAIAASFAHFAASQPSIGATSTATFASPAMTYASPAAQLAQPSAGRAMLDAMTLPMLGDADASGGAAAGAPSWSAPGMIAERAHSFSVAQERSTSDLALDFVTPELILAARVYGLGPAEAAQAVRLAIAGPGQLTAMAGTVDRTFVQAMAIDADRKATASAAQSAGYRALAGSVETPMLAEPARAALIAQQAAVAQAQLAQQVALTPVQQLAQEQFSAPASIAAAIASAPSGSAAATQAFASGSSAAPGTAFGVERRSPRGAFLWPSATVAALGMNAAMPDGQLSMSVAALELLAAQAVAELGTYAALTPDAPAGRALPYGAAPAEAANDLASPAAFASSGTASAAAAASPYTTGTTAYVAAQSAAAVAAAQAVGREPAEADVLGAAAAIVPSAQRARFEALYLALAQSSAGKGWTPAARAARALALAGRSDSDLPTSARDRAAAAWAVLPVVYAGNEEVASFGAAPSLANAPFDLSALSFAAPSMRGPGGQRSASSRSGSAPSLTPFAGFGDAGDFAVNVSSSPGLAALSARSGEALGSYVSPTVVSPVAATVTSQDRRDGAVHRAPTAAQELVRTGRPAGRFGGGEVEIPAWFESAARKMLDQSSSGGDISLAELTLVASAPSSHIAASTRSAPSSAPPAPADGSSDYSGNAPQIDVEKLAGEVYRYLMTMMDHARARNGEPYL
ncbi:MAG TPA: hypothetical protein VGM88_00350 [Kofleriaceae bacterium]